MHQIPSYVFLLVITLVFFLLGVIAHTLFSEKGKTTGLISHAVDKAKQIASSLWKVENPKIIDDDVVIRLRHLSWSTQSFILPVRPGHPDIHKFRNLRGGETIEFEALNSGMECALEHELCGYLRIKSIS